MFFLVKNNFVDLHKVKSGRGSPGVEKKTTNDGGSRGGGDYGSGEALLRFARRVNRPPGTEAMASSMKCASTMANAMDRQAAAA